MELTDAQEAELLADLAALKVDLQQTLSQTASHSDTVELDQAAVGRISRVDALQAQKMAEAQKTGRSLRETAAAELKKLSPAVAERLEALFDPLEAVRAKSLPGGTAPEAVQASLDAALAALGAD